MSEVEPLDEPTPSQGEQSVESGGGEKRSRRWRGFSGSSPRPKTASLHIGANEPARRSLLSVNSVEGEAVESAPRKSIGDLDTIASASLVAAQSGTNTNTTATSTTTTATAADSARDRDREREREQQEKKSAGGPLDWFKQKIHEREERRAEKQAEKEMKRAKSPEGVVVKNNRGASMLSLSSSPPPAPSNAMTMEGREKEGRERRERRERSMDVSRKDDQGTIKRRGDEGGLKEGREEREDVTPTGLPPAQQQQQGVGQQQSQAQVVGVQSSTQTQNTGAGSWRSSSPVPPKASLPIP